MTGRERISRIFKRLPVDRVGVYEQFWNDAIKKWVSEKKISSAGELAERFGFDIAPGGGINLTADIDFVPEIIAEDESTVTSLDGNGATFRRFKSREGVMEHIGFAVRCRGDWERLIKPKLTPTPARAAFEHYRETKRKAEENGRFLAFYCSNVFSMMTCVAGHEHILHGMADDPEWIDDMCETYAGLLCEMQALIGGMDAREIESNDFLRIKAEIDAKMPVLMAKGGYILHSDHSISNNVEYESLEYFIDYGKSAGTYRKTIFA